MSTTDTQSTVADLRASNERTPPQDIGAEQSVLGALLLSKDAIADVIETMNEADFYRPAHQTIFAAVQDLYGSSEAVDAVTVADYLAKKGSLARVGGAPYLHSLTNAVPVASNGAYYARIVAEQAVLRRLVEAGTRIAQMGYAAEGQVGDLVDTAEAEIFKVSGARGAEDYQPLGELMPGAFEEIEAIDSRGGQLVGVPTSFTDFDHLTNGLHPGQMVIVAARPAMGKSTVGLDFARSASVRHGLTSAIFSLEMGRNEIIMRLLSAEARVPLQHLRNGGLSDQDWRRLSYTQSELASAPLFIDDSPNLTMMEIRAKCRRLKQKHDLRLVVIDYLQLMTSGRKVESRQQEVSEFSRNLKLLAKELEVPVVAISQLNRGPEQRTDKKPMISDLRESGSLEQDADLVMLLHREDAYDRDARPGEADFIVAKHRNGPTKTITVAFQGHYSRFVDMAHE